MAKSSGLQLRASRSGRLFATVWPPMAANDSESLRRRKFAVRAGHLAMAVMIATILGGALLSNAAAYSAGQTVALCVASVVYVIWNLVGTRGVVTFVLWEKGVPPPIETRVPRFGARPYFVVQMALAGLAMSSRTAGGCRISRGWRCCRRSRMRFSFSNGAASGSFRC